MSLGLPNGREGIKATRTRSSSGWLSAAGSGTSSVGRGAAPARMCSWPTWTGACGLRTRRSPRCATR